VRGIVKAWSMRVWAMELRLVYCDGRYRVRREEEEERKRGREPKTCSTPFAREERVAIGDWRGEN